MAGARERRPAVAGGNRRHDTTRPDIETSSDEYASRFSGPAGAFLLERQRAAVTELIQAAAPAPLHVLELGGGHGQLLPSLLSAGHQVTIHGSDPVCFRRVAPELASHSRQVACCVSSLWELPFQTGTFDRVVGLRLLAHVVRWQELLDEIVRVSRCLVLIDFPLHRGGQRLAGALFGLKRTVERRTTRPFFLYSEQDVVAHLRWRGMQVAGRRGQFALPIALHRAIGSPRISQALERGLSRVQVAERARSPVLLLARRATPPVGTSAEEDG